MRVLLFRDAASSSDDSWEVALAARGHVATSIGVVSVALRDAGALSEVLSQRPPPWAFALTSRHAAAALSSALASAPADVKRARLFCVGARTAEPLGTAESRVEGTSAGNAGALAALIVAAAAADAEEEGGGAVTRRVLFVCGAQRLDTLPAALRGANVDVTEIVVYDTEPVAPDALAAAIERAGGVRTFAAAVVFSPSGFAAACAGGAFLRCEGPHEPRLIAIGPSTAAAMNAAGFHALIAAAPNADAVADVLESLRESTALPE